MKKILCCCLLIFSLCGCAADMKDMYNLAFPTSMALDFKEDQFEVTLQIINANSLSKPELESSINKGEILITSAQGGSISDAIQKLENKLRMEIVLTNINTVFLTEKMTAKEPFDAFLNYLLINPELRLTTSMFINDGDMKEIFEVKHNITSSPYFSLVAYTSQDRMSSLELPDKALSILKNYYNNTEVSIIPNMDTDKDSTLFSDGESNEQLRYDINRLTLLDCQTFTTFDIEEVQGLEYLTNKESKNAVEMIKQENSTINFLIEGIKKSTFYKEGMFHVRLDTIISIGASELDMDEQEIVNLITEHIKTSVTETYATLLDHQIDYLRLQNLNEDPLTIDKISFDVNVSLQTKTNYLK